MKLSASFLTSPSAGVSAGIAVSLLSTTSVSAFAPASLASTDVGDTSKA